MKNSSILIAFLVLATCIIASPLFADSYGPDPYLISFLDSLIDPKAFYPHTLDKLYAIEHHGSQPDKSFIALTDYYIGAAGGECLDELITKRGKRMLPLLMEKRKRPLDCLPKYQSLCVETVSDRNDRINELIKAIKNGVVLCVEYDNCPEPEK
jgi:hypothetical protein